MTAIRVLIVEDSETDAKLVVNELLRAGMTPEWERVETPEAMRSALGRAKWDVIIGDWSMPHFGALQALVTLKQSGLDIPFLVVSGTIGEEKAVDAMHAGAHDFVLKDRLARLVPAIEREIRDHELRRSHRISEARFARLAESGIIGIAFGDVLGNLHDANEAYLRMLGYRRTDLVLGRMRWADMTPAEWAVADLAAVKQLEATGVAAPREKELLHKDGTRVPVLIGVAMLDPPNCISFIADLTERKLAEKALRHSEEQLRQAQKMDALGGLAAGVAHDFNNLLSVILSYADLAIQDLAHDAPLRADLTQVRHAGQRAAALTRQLLAFSRQQVLQPRVVDLNEVLTGAEKLLRRLLREDIDLVLLTAPRLHRVEVDPGQIEQVLMNLVVNARDAMPGGGKVTIEIANAPVGERCASNGALTGATPCVILKVSDTGCGIDAATQARMFEPFFTTKEKGKGTGLGLPTVLGIVQQSGGTIAVESEPGRGATFIIRLPVADRAGDVPVTSKPPEGAALRGSETILLVEDDESLRVLARTILLRHGYHVLEAQSGGDALVLCEDSAKIDLLLTDVVMPRMSGRELTARLQALRPEMRVLYMSGYTDDSVVHHGVLASDVGFLQKPITPETLTRKVREVLDARPA